MRAQSPSFWEGELDALQEIKRYFSLHLAASILHPAKCPSATRDTEGSTRGEETVEGAGARMSCHHSDSK